MFLNVKQKGVEVPRGLHSLYYRKYKNKNLIVQVLFDAIRLLFFAQFCCARNWLF